MNNEDIEKLRDQLKDYYETEIRIASDYGLVTDYPDVDSMNGKELMELAESLGIL